MMLISLCSHVFYKGCLFMCYRVIYLYARTICIHLKHLEGELRGLVIEKCF